MKSILMSIKPKWVEKIASGEKTVEVRKSVPKCGTPFKVYIYCTQDKNYKIAPFDFADGWHIKKYDDTTNYACGCSWRKRDDLNGKVVGEFVCDEVYNFIQAGAGIMFADKDLNQLDPQDARDMTCLTDKDIEDYLGNSDGYGLHISDLKIYDKPRELWEFGYPCDGDCDCCKYERIKEDRIDCYRMVERPPQSWCYVEEL